MPVAHAFRLPIIAATTALALSGCVHTSSPVATEQPPGRSRFDGIRSGLRATAAQLSGTTSAAADSGGAIGALRGTFAAAPRPSYAPVPVVYAAAPPTHDAVYRLDAGDKLRVVVYGQEGLTNSYAIGAGGAITVPLIGSVPARGRTPAELAAEITARLRKGFIRDPSVAVEIESYRPFFILGEVAAPGQYPYVPNMSVESAVAIAGGFSPRAKRDCVTLTHTDSSGSIRTVVPLGTPMNPGDTVQVGERWF